jgi:asparagine synthase (glutamine-hydrolysing)
MIGTLWRRGPDGEGQWRSDDKLCWLGHRRLAIIDLVTGNQPMTNEDGTIWTVFNGEIYNYQMLRTELIDIGHRFHTNSDTEVLVHGYEQWGGIGLCKRLRGIFAFAIYDTKAKRLFLARDHLGVKPLHWWTDGRVFLFASEIKSLLRHPACAQRRVSNAGVAQFIVSRYVSRPNTMFEGFFKLPEASCLEIEVGRENSFRPETYWDVSYSNKENQLSFNETLDQLEHLLKETVRMQLMSDVPLGAQLSGGVDSSVVVALMEQIRQESGGRHRVKTFSVGFDVERYSELKYAKMIADRYETDHHEIRVGAKEFIEELPLLFLMHDDPLGDPPAIPTYFMCKAAKEKVTVMLCGEGADEQFGGYFKYAADQYSRFIDWLPSKIRYGLLRGTAAMLPFKARRVRSILEILAMDDRASRFSSWYGAFDKALQKTLLSQDLRDQVGDRYLSEVFGSLLAECDSSHQLDQFLYCDIHTRLVEDMLVVGDRMSMGASVEARVPFLDHHVVEFAAGLDRKFKVKGLRTKILLKKLAEKYAPSELIYRRKVGFTLPLSDWMLGPMRPLISNVLLSDRFLSRNYFNPDMVRKIVDEHLEQKVDREQGIWVLFALEIWHRIFVDDDGTEEAAQRLSAELQLNSFCAAL